MFRAIQQAAFLRISRHFGYDIVGNLVWQTDPARRGITYSYDNLYQRTQEKWFNDDQPLNRQLSFVCDVANRLTSDSDPSVTRG